MSKDGCNCNKKAYCPQLNLNMCIHDIRKHYAKHPNHILSFLCSTSSCRQRSITVSVVHSKTPENECKRGPHLKAINVKEHDIHCPFHGEYSSKPEPEIKISDESQLTQTNFKQDSIIDIFDPRKPQSYETQAPPTDNPIDSDNATTTSTRHGHSLINPEHHNKNRSHDFVRLIQDFLTVKKQNALKTRKLRVVNFGEVPWNYYFSPVIREETESMRMAKVSYGNIREVVRLNSVYAIHFWHKAKMPSHTLFINLNLFSDMTRHARLNALLNMLCETQESIQKRAYFIASQVLVEDIENPKTHEKRQYYKYYISDLSYLVMC